MQRHEEYDFFELIRALFLEGLKFAAKNPEFTLVGERLFRDKNHPLYDEVMGDAMQNAQNFYTELLKQAALKGELRDGLDLDFIGHSISSLNLSAVEYYFGTHKKNNAGIKDFNENMIGTIELLLDFIKYGIGTQKKGGSKND